MANPAQIEIDYGSFYLSMDLVNIDTLYYSLGMKTTCRLQKERFIFQHPELRFSVEALERFVGELSAIAKDSGELALLHDFSEWFRIGVKREDDSVLCEVVAHRKSAADGSIATLTYSFNTDMDFVALLRDHFREFPKWW